MGLSEAKSALTPHEAFRAAVDKLGSGAAMARRLGVAQPTVSRWLTRQKGCPPKFAVPVEEATGISRHALRPDIYPVAAEADPAADRHNGVRA